jgi:aspartate aminotransferase-like enzyme
MTSAESRTKADLEVVGVEGLPEQTFVAPGPTPLPPEVRQALAQPMLHHRAAPFRSSLRRVRSGLQWVAGTENPVILLACTGTGAMESAIVNLCNPGDAVAIVAAGYFGERWVALAERYGCDVVPLRYEWGSVPKSEDLARTLEQRPDVKAVFLVHSETSTGVVLDLQRFAAVAKSAGAMLVADAVSSFAAVPIELDAWGIDVLVSSSHKALMSPPGIAFVIASPAALEAAKAASRPRYYLDWQENLVPQQRDEPETWFSPAISLVLALDAALTSIQEQGLDAVYRRHLELGRQCRSGVKALGLELFSPDDDSAAVMTAVRMPEAVDSTRLVAALHDRWAVTVADGEAVLKGNIIRIGHLGYVNASDVERALEALGAAFAELRPQRHADLAPALTRRARAAGSPAS